MLAECHLNLSIGITLVAQTVELAHDQSRLLSLDYSNLPQNIGLAGLKLERYMIALTRFGRCASLNLDAA